ncbi:DUF2809 domain-containing protein [Dactylosporangium sp. NPDC051485]|uniref:ribosomal maturation YjgA family protein n=1 Tax=Dactylosporangium sp. NPDC051485 TaxID=3154846 RepID=UPI0034489EEF
MLQSTTATRIAAVLTAAAATALALGLRAVLSGDVTSTGALEQNSGTALYASAVYAAVVFLRPAAHPLTAGAWALAWCWAVELAQLTPVPRTLSAQSILLRLVFGNAFDWTDVWWYPVGIVPLVLAHHALRRARTEPDGREP